jgi:HSP20 family protein
MEAGEFADDIRQIFHEPGRTFGLESLAGECRPPIDVYETDEAIQISMDLPGVSPSSVRVMIKGTSVLIAGEKTPRRGRGDSSFHLVERAVGRFARSVKMTSPFDAAGSRATLRDGELLVTCPKIPERRNRPIEVPIE